MLLVGVGVGDVSGAEDDAGDVSRRQPVAVRAEGDAAPLRRQATRFQGRPHGAHDAAVLRRVEGMVVGDGLLEFDPLIADGGDNLRVDAVVLLHRVLTRQDAPLHPERALVRHDVDGRAALDHAHVERRPPDEGMRVLQRGRRDFLLQRADHAAGAVDGALTQPGRGAVRRLAAHAQTPAHVAALHRHQAQPRRLPHDGAVRAEAALDQVQAADAKCLLADAGREGQFPRQRFPLRDYGLQRQQHRRQGSLVVAGPEAVEDVAFLAHGEGVLRPVHRLHGIHVGGDEQRGAGTTTLHAGQHVVAVRLDFLEFRLQTQPLELADDVSLHPGFAVPAVGVDAVPAQHKARRRHHFGDQPPSLLFRPCRH